MTEAAQESAPKTPAKSKSRAKDNSASIMKELTGLMSQRTALMNQIRAKKADLAQLESSLQELGTEITWRANVFGLATQPGTGAAPPSSSAYSAPGQPQPVLTQPIFRSPEPPANASGINRQFADLSSLV